MKRIFLLILAALFSLVIHAQDSTDCATPDMDTTDFYNFPWFDNNQLLEDFLDSIGYPNPSMRIVDQGIRYWIPVKFWIYRDNPQTGLTYYNYLSVQAKNACGTSDPSATSQFNVGPIPSTCGGGGGCCQVQASPNPTTGSMTVETTDNSEFTRLRIVDKAGQIRKQYTYAATKKVTLNVSDLPADLYRVQVFINNQWASASFIKQ